MSTKAVDSSAWTRFRSRNLAVVPELVGKSHEFEFDGTWVSIGLPPVEAVTPIDQLKTLDHHNQIRLSFNAYKEIDGEKVPVFYWVHLVDMIVRIDEQVQIPPELLDRPPNAYDLVTDDQKTMLNRTADDAGGVADRAFDYWIRVLRWKARNPWIGRPQVRGPESGWSVYLLERSSQHRYWAGETVFTVPVTLQVSSDHWKEAELALKSRQEPPVYIDFFYDAQYHRTLDDFRTAVVDLAVSIETVMRSRVLRALPASMGDQARAYIERASIIRYIDDFYPEVLNEADRQRFSEIKGDLKAFVNARNAIVHRGEVDVASLPECEIFEAAASNLIEIESGTSPEHAA